MESDQSGVKHKSFSYSTALAWTSGRIGILSSESKPLIQVSSPPEFKGQAGNWTPEDLFVGTVEMCQMLTFLALAQKQHLPLVSYKSTAQGALEFVDGMYRFTHIVITPSVVVEAPATEIETQALLREAHKRCLIANSIRASIEINASVVLVEEVMNGETIGPNEGTF